MVPFTLLAISPPSILQPGRTLPERPPEGTEADASLLRVAVRAGGCGEAAEDVDGFLLDVRAEGAGKHDALVGVPVDDAGGDDPGDERHGVVAAVEELLITSQG